MSENYTAKNIKVLHGLEPIKKRPGMYTRKDSPTHIAQEVIDNAGDEALGGYAKNIEVTVYKDGSVSVKDDGRGIPVDMNEEEGRPAIELIFMELHSGGKFDKEKEDSETAYTFSGGLHGVGVSCTNALSKRLDVEVRRDGKKYKIGFVEGGKIGTPLTEFGTCAKRDTGTLVRFWPDPQYFDSGTVNLRELEHLVRSKAVLLPGTNVKLLIETANGFEEKSWTFEGGLAQYLDECLPAIEDPEFQPIPLFLGESYVAQDSEVARRGEGARWAIAFRPQGGGTGESYVNLIPTLNGGFHVSGMKLGVFDAVRSFMDHHNLVQRGIKVTSEDVNSNLNFILDAKLRDPDFQGQTKETLNNREAYKLVSNGVKSELETWLNHHVEYGKRIVEMANKSAAARAKNNQKFEKRKSSGVNMMPVKLKDCERAGTPEAEIFLVEGDSAGGSANQARDRDFQAMLPLRGKIQNTWEIDANQIFKNNEVHDIFVTLNIEPHTLSDTDVDLSGLRYNKVISFTDADVDGSHIRTLLIALFCKHAPQIILRGHLYVAMPPLYRIDVPSVGKAKPARKIYAADDKEKASTIEHLAREGIDVSRLTVQRFKGLGEMNPDQLWETGMCPDTRRLVRVVMSPEKIQETVDLFDKLLKKKETDWRKSWLERRGNEVVADV